MLHCVRCSVCVAMCVAAYVAVCDAVCVLQQRWLQDVRQCALQYVLPR